MHRNFTRNWKLKSFIGITLLNLFGCSVMASDTFADSNKGYFFTGHTIIPHPEKAYKGGEDALVVRDRLIAVADGVGGWADHGVDPGLYSKKLVQNIGLMFDEDNSRSPKEILIRANHMTKETGTSTAVIAILHPENSTIVSTLLGDSSYLLLRPNVHTGIDKLFRSEEQQKRFNFPYQCGTGGDHPKLAIDNRHNIQHNDIVVMGSDGVFDNCFDEEIIEIVKKRLQPNGDIQDPQETSLAIAKLAEEHGIDQTWRSPFQVGAEKAFHRRVFQGGKQDDISVIVSQVKLE